VAITPPPAGNQHPGHENAPPEIRIDVLPGPAGNIEIPLNRSATPIHIPHQLVQPDLFGDLIDIADVAIAPRNSAISTATLQGADTTGVKQTRGARNRRISECLYRLLVKWIKISSPQPASTMFS
jgi:hypothetical protein